MKDISSSALADQYTLPDDDPDVVTGMASLALLREAERDLPDVCNQNDR